MSVRLAHYHLMPVFVCDNFRPHWTAFRLITGTILRAALLSNSPFPLCIWIARWLLVLFSGSNVNGHADNSLENPSIFSHEALFRDLGCSSHFRHPLNSKALLDLVPLLCSRLNTLSHKYRDRCGKISAVLLRLFFVAGRTSKLQSIGPCT